MSHNFGKRSVVVTSSIPERQALRVIQAARRKFDESKAKSIAYAFLSAHLRPGDTLVSHNSPCPFLDLLSVFNQVALPPSTSGRVVHALTEPSHNKLTSVRHQLKPGDLILTYSTAEDLNFLSMATSLSLVMIHSDIEQGLACIFDHGPEDAEHEPFEVNIDDFPENLILLHASSPNIRGNPAERGLYAPGDEPIVSVIKPVIKRRRTVHKTPKSGDIRP